MMNIPRIRRLIKSSAEDCKLNLTGLTILTEAATGYYALTPIIAALASADSVLALARTTRFGDARSVGNNLLILAKEFEVESKISILYDKNDTRIGMADIVTNLGMIRPLDNPFLSKLKTTACIPLMWETWEFRASDLDLPACRKLGIPVLGTDEHQPKLDIFRYVGLLPLKLLLESGIEVFKSKIAVLGSGEFAEQALTTLRNAGAEVIHISPQLVNWPELLLKCASLLDAICVIEHHSHDALIGPMGPLSAQRLAFSCPGLTVIHVCGNVDRESLSAAGVLCYPLVFAPPGSMSVATDYVGPKPLIDLHTAGLRVGEVMARLRLQGFSCLEVEAYTLRQEPLSQAFHEDL